MRAVTRSTVTRSTVTRSTVALAVAVAGLVVLGLVQSIPNRHGMENDLTARSLRALRDAGLTGVEVSFVGRDGTVRVHSPADAGRALSIVEGQTGVRVATVEVIPQPARLPTVRAAVDGGRVVLDGTVPTDGARTALVAAVAAVFGASGVDDHLTVDAGVNDTGLAGIGDVLAALGKDAKQATVELRDGRITLTGTVASQQAKDSAVRAAARVTGSTSTVDDRLVVATAQPAPPPQSPPPPQEIQARLAALPTITFETASAVLTADGRAVVANAAAILAANPDVRVRIEGHTDSRGTAEANQVLSQQRADTVLLTLQSLGIAASRMTAVGYGESRPKVPDTSEVNMAVNRRVEFVVLS
jgi:outer membrane protein OmpA-like peptidoglycan-associated protein